MSCLKCGALVIDCHPNAPKEQLCYTCFYAAHPELMDVHTQHPDSFRPSFTASSAPGKPLVSVMVATHNRHDQLVQCIKSIQAQDYPYIEIIVVSDGPDEELGRRFYDPAANEGAIDRSRSLRYFETGRNWHSLSGLSWGTEPRTLAAFAARGDYLCYVDDDDTITPDHVSSLVNALHGTEHWFALGQYKYPDGRILGNGTIAPSMVGTCMILFRPECLCASVMRPGSYLGDFEWIARMAQAGMTWTHVPKPTYLVAHALEAVGTR